MNGVTLGYFSNKSGLWIRRKGEGCRTREVRFSQHTSKGSPDCRSVCWSIVNRSTRDQLLTMHVMLVHRNSTTPTPPPPTPSSSRPPTQHFAKVPTHSERGTVRVFQIRNIPAQLDLGWPAFESGRALDPDLSNNKATVPPRFFFLLYFTTQIPQFRNSI